MGDDDGTPGGKSRATAPSAPRPAVLETPEAELERLRTAVDLATHGTWGWDFDSGELHWSEARRRRLGMTRRDLPLSVDEFFERIHPDDVAAVRAALDAHLNEGRPYEVVMRLRHEEGHYIAEKVRGRVHRDDDGRPYRMSGVVIDATPELEAKRALEVSELRFQDMAANLPGVALQYARAADGRARVEYVSDGCEDLWELTPEALIRDPDAVWSMVHPDDRAAMRRSVARSMATMTPWSRRWRIVSASGTVKWVQGRAIPNRLPDGGILWNSLLLDISDHIRVEQQLTESRELLFRSQKMEALGQLTGGLAHDFNNLLMVVMSGLEALATDDVALPDEHERALHDALEATRRGAALTRSLLGFARRAPLAPEEFDLCETTRELYPLLRRTLAANIDLQLTAPGEARVCLDRACLENAVLNLVLNARDALPDGGRVCIDITSDERDVRLSVADDGIGMSEEVQARIFEPFFTTKGRKGTGMGLATLHGFMSQSGGDVTLASTPGEGTTVTLAMPRSISEEAQRPPMKSEPPPSLGRVRILYVEDDRIVRRAVLRTLQLAQFDVTVAHLGDEALRRIDAAPSAFDVVLTDMQMPGAIQGEDLARELGARVPVILMTGSPPESQVAGATQVLIKPVEAKVLVDAIRLALRANTDVVA